MPFVRVVDIGFEPGVVGIGVIDVEGVVPGWVVEEPDPMFPGVVVDDIGFVVEPGVAGAGVIGVEGVVSGWVVEEPDPVFPGVDAPVIPDCA